MAEKERKKRVDRLAFLGTMAGGLAHEVKNPLSTMSVNLQLLKEDWENPETPREVRTLKRVDILMREIGRLESVVNNFLNFARGFSLEPKPANLNELIQELVDFMNPEALRHKIRVSTFLDPELQEVRLDWKYVQKALMNIIHNAFQALDSVEENKREVLVRTTRQPKGVEVSITDTGPGIDPAMKDKIFQVFFSTKKDGTGMGLPMVRRIVEEHDGSVSLHTEMGKGTSFVLFFPFAGPRDGGDHDARNRRRA